MKLPFKKNISRPTINIRQTMQSKEREMKMMREVRVDLEPSWVLAAVVASTEDELLVESGFSVELLGLLEPLLVELLELLLFSSGLNNF